MTLYKLVSIVALASVLLLDQSTKVDACMCALEVSLCDSVAGSDIVLRGTELSSQDDSMGEGGVLPQYKTYTIGVSAVYKGELDVTDGQEIEVTTPFFASACGVDLAEGEYLLGLFRDDDDVLSMTACGLVRAWSSVSDVDEAALEAGCEDSGDPCFGACSQTQECVQYQRNEKWYCSDTCDGVPCFRTDRCTTRARSWCRESGAAGCPEIAECTRVVP